ncbi:MAG: hypothetical protein IPI64_08080 [Chloracidobacterium sp.]|nr:hypothetical protein [Chloracidobacterium sp.]
MSSNPTQFTRAMPLVAIIFAVLLVVANVSAQKVRLRSQITPNCTAVSGTPTWKFADIFADGNIAVQGSYNCRGAAIYDISNPDAPTLSTWYNPIRPGTASTNEQFLEAIVVGNRGYFGSGNGGGVYIVDLTTPSNPILLGRVNSTSGSGHNSIHEMMVFDQGGATYLLENFNSTSTKPLKIINITNPAVPVLKWEFTPIDVTWVHAFHIRGNRMYTSGWGGRIEIYDIGNLATQAPALIGSIVGNTTNHSTWTSEDGRYLYSCRETLDGDLRVYDVLNPAAPVLVRSIKTSELGLNAVTPHNPVVVGNYLYIAWYQAGIQVFDLTDPTFPKKIAQYDTFSPTFAPPAEVSDTTKGTKKTRNRALADNEPWDIVCGAENLQNALPSSYDGNWAVFPLIGQDKVLAGDMTNGLLVLDATGVATLPKNVVSDFDGDKRTDFSVYHPSNGGWQIERSSDGLAVPIRLRAAPVGDVIVPGDYDGDGISEIGTYRPTTAQWTARKVRPFGPARNLISGIYGSPGDIPVPADYDADGRTDVAQWRPSTGTWQMWRSTLGTRTVLWTEFRGTGSTLTQVSTDKPVIGDYDGDGKIDLGVWRPSTGTFYIQQSSSSILLTIVLGQNGDRPVSADFDGNGISDTAVYRPSNGTWYFRDPITGVSSSFVWGNPEDTPIPADYDGDGKSDFAVFRPSTNQWLRINSTNGNTIDRVFGQFGDMPSPAAIQPQ